MARNELPNGVILPAEYSDDWYDDMTSNLSKLDAVIGSDAEKLSAENVGAAALSNDYTDLDNKPALKPVATSGDYDDLDNKPDLKPVATSGDYDDLTDLPTYGITRYCSSAITDNSSVAFSAISSTNKIKVGDFLLDTNGKLYQISSVDTANETVSVTTPLTQLALDGGVMHLSGNETASGIKSFSDETYIKALNFTNEVPSPSSSSSSILPIITTITYGDSSPSVQARLNLSVTADGTKSFYPHENNQYSLGLVSRRWSTVFGAFANLGGVYLGNEANTNQRTNLYLLANRDTDGQSGCYVTRYRRNKAQGAFEFSDLQQIGIDFLENSVRTTNIFNIIATNWTNDVPGRILINSGVANNSFGSTIRKCYINELNPGALSLPDLNNAIDISGYLTAGNSNNTYTPPANGWISISIGIASGGIAIFIEQGDMKVSSFSNTTKYQETNCSCFAYLPVVEGVVVNIGLKGSNNFINSAKFFPCLGNV